MKEIIHIIIMSSVAIYISSCILSIRDMIKEIKKSKEFNLMFKEDLGFYIVKE